jgi:C-terminal processing protease CtpA/Prc
MRAVAVLLLAGVLAAQHPALTREQLAEDLRQLAREAAAKWAYAEDRRENAGVDLERLAEEAVARLPDEPHEASFHAALCELVAALQDGHAWVQWDRAPPAPFRHAPFTLADTADGLLVDELVPAWNGTAVALQRGDELVAIDGVPVQELLAAIARRTFASTPGARRRSALRELPFGASEPRRYTVRRGGEELTVAAAAARHLPRSPREEPVAFRWHADGVAGIRIATFAHRDGKAWAAAAPEERDALLAAEVATLRAAFAQAAGARALVLDLRGNGGGTDLLGMEVAACLLPADSVYYGLASRRWLGPGWAKPGQHRLRVRGEPPRFGGQLLVLIDAGVFSVTDNLCRCLDDLHPDVTFVGAATGGGSGAPRPCITLAHSGAVVTLCTMRVTGPHGELIEGRGTVPDVPVRTTRAGVLAGRDEVVEAALARVRAR